MEKTDFSDQKFRRAERLKSKKVIAAMFKTGKSVAAYPLRLVWLENPELRESVEAAPFQITIAVPKKHFKRAVDRNLLRRRTREAFRLYKKNVYAKMPGNQHFAWLIMFTAREILEYSEIERGMKKLMRRFQDAQNAPPPVSKPENP
ncbi:MAG: hypothetical protein RL757_2690 [Bacteroidota bacterium]|jgi:ribonuclease P protein component